MTVIKTYVEEFLVFMESKGSDKTSQAYKYHLDTFAEMMFSRPLEQLVLDDLYMVDSEMVLKYRHAMYISQLFTNGTINNKMTALRKFLRYMKHRGLIDYNIKDDAEFIVNLKEDSVPYDTIPMKMVPQIIDYIRTKEKHLKKEKEWFVKLAVETGLRTSNILHLRKSDFSHCSDGIHVMIKANKDNMGKGNERWTEFIHKDFYNEIVKDFFGENDKLFTTNRSTMLKSIKKIIAKLGYEGNYVLHSFKRTAVNNTKDFTNDLHAAQLKGKHKNPTTTSKNYLDDIGIGATGYYSMQYKTKEDLISTASHEELLKAIDGLDENVIILIQMQLQKLKGES